MPIFYQYRGWCIKFATGLNGRFTTISSHFVANYIDIFHKTVVQMVILRCWTGLYLIWFKNYATNNKKQKTKESAKSMKNIIQMSAFLQNRKNSEIEIFVFCVITFDPIKVHIMQLDHIRFAKSSFYFWPIIWNFQ